MSEDKPQLADLTGKADPVFSAMALLAGMQLEVFSALAEGPCAAHTLADRLSIDPSRLERLLYILAGTGFLRVSDGQFTNSPLAEAFLVKGREGYAGGVHELWTELFGAALRTADSVRSGAPEALHDFKNMSKDELRAFFRGLHGGAVGAGKTLARALNLGRFDLLLDVGGGSGGLAIGACEVTPELKAVVSELPEVAEITHEFIDAAGMSDRISVEVADLVNGGLSGTYDVAILRHLLQTVGESDAAAILKAVGAAMRPGGEIHILGWILENSRLAPAQALNFDLVFLNIYEAGASYPVNLHEAWLTEAGFSEVTAHPAPSGATPPGTMLISATKK